MILLTLMMIHPVTCYLIQSREVQLYFDHYFRAEVIINSTSKPTINWYLDFEHIGSGTCRYISNVSYVFATELHEETSCGKTLQYKAVTVDHVLQNSSYLDFQCHGHIHYLNVPVFAASTSSVVLLFLGIFIVAYFSLKKKENQVQQSILTEKSERNSTKDREKSERSPTKDREKLEKEETKYYKEGANDKLPLFINELQS